MSAVTSSIATALAATAARTTTTTAATLAATTPAATRTAATATTAPAPATASTAPRPALRTLRLLLPASAMCLFRHVFRTPARLRGHRRPTLSRGHDIDNRHDRTRLW